MNLTRKFNDYPSAYKNFEAIPQHLRLENYSDVFSDRDVWEEYVNEHLAGRVSQNYIDRLNHAGNSWKNICQAHDRHHALAEPSIVSAWCQKLTESKKLSTVRNNYLSKVDRFYRYLMWNIEYPHTYNPVLYSVINHKCVKTVYRFEYSGENHE